MNFKNLFIIAAAGLCLASCATKSGHRSRSKSSGQRVEAKKSNSSSSDLNVDISDKHGDSEKLEGKDIFAKYNTAVFMIYTTDGQMVAQGSGFFINPNGLAVSNYHVFEGTAVGAEAIKFVGSEEAYKVSEIIHKDKDQDFILFRVNVSDNNYIPIARQKPQIGEKVYALGSPRGLENTFSSGEISQWREENFMQISALIDHGSSGGALINEYGEAVGITSGTLYEGSQANLNYAWSIDVIKPYINR